MGTCLPEKTATDTMMRTVIISRNAVHLMVLENSVTPPAIVMHGLIVDVMAGIQDDAKDEPASVPLMVIENGCGSSDGGNDAGWEMRIATAATTPTSQGYTSSGSAVQGYKRMRELLKPSASIALPRHSNALVDVHPPKADSGISLLGSSEKPNVLYSCTCRFKSAIAGYFRF